MNKESGDKKLGGGRIRLDARPDSAPRNLYLFTFALLIFFVALGVRVLSWHDSRYEIEKVQSSVTSDYKHVARLLQQGGIGAFFSPTSPLADLNTLGHPPGYSILLAIVFGIFGESNASVQFVQIVADSLGSVVTFLIAAALLPRAVALIAGTLAALSPQFTWNSVLLLPDTLATLPVLLAVYCVVLATKRPRLAFFVAAGALVGVSCWLRANALLLAPFLAIVVLLLFERARRVRFALALVVGALAVIAPLTIRNAVVFRHFIPLSLGAGQTLLEGIADYDRERRFGIPDTDLAIIRQEAVVYNRPDYAGTLFGPDGVWRERQRLARGFNVIRENPLWFSTVVVRRAASMLRLERAPRVQPEPPVSHPLDIAADAPPAWAASPQELSGGGQVLSQKASVSLSSGEETLTLVGDDSKYERQFAAPPVAVEAETDYVLVVPLKIERGRMTVGVEDADGGAVYASTVVETMEGRTPEEQPSLAVRVPFVSRESARVRLFFSNAASAPAHPVARVGRVSLFRLGAASQVWTRYPRVLVSNVQKLFVTAFMLPLFAAGFVFLLRARAWRTLVVLSAVPFYYFCVQSMLHTEYRYILAIYYFLFVLAAVSFYVAGGILWNGARKILARPAAAAGEPSA
ncbi:MAG TPA: glycosyltransferase family 39 protein [Pyrinomonadaceae bacterium]|nr:glycosyltransferase family 39 protein [Pyrinomonadaceae bacterium]